MTIRLSVDPEAPLAALCRRHHISRLSLFGSLLKGTARINSDVDLLAEFVPGQEPGLLGLAGIEAELSALLGGRQVEKMGVASPTAVGGRASRADNYQISKGLFRR